MDAKYLVINWSKNHDTWASAEQDRRPVYELLETATLICADHDQQPHVEVWDDVADLDAVENALDDCDSCLSYRWIVQGQLKTAEPDEIDRLEDDDVELLYGPDYTHYISDTEIDEPHEGKGAGIMEKYTQQLIDEVEAVGDGYEGHIYSVAKLTGTNLDANDISGDAWDDVRVSINEANAKIDQNYTLELCEFARDKWDIRLRRVYDDAGNMINAD